MHSSKLTVTKYNYFFFLSFAFLVNIHFFLFITFILASVSLTFSSLLVLSSVTFIGLLLFDFWFQDLDFVFWGLLTFDSM